MIHIKADCTQLGLSVEASNDDGATWQLVDLYKYQARSGGGMDPARDRQEYLEHLRARGIEFKVCREG